MKLELNHVELRELADKLEAIEKSGLVYRCEIIMDGYDYCVSAYWSESGDLVVEVQV